MAAEQKLEAVVTRYAKDRGVLSYKFVSPSHRGVPDRLFIFPTGFVLFMEFKAHGKKLEPLQRSVIERFVRQGALVAVIVDSTTAYSLIDELLAKKMEIKPK